MVLARTLGRNTLRLGRAFQPSLKPAVIGGAAVGGLAVSNQIVRSYGRARNPPLQTVDTDGDGNPDFLFDPRTGQPWGFGPQGDPSYQGDPERNKDRDKDRLLMGGIVAAAGLVAVLVLKGGK